MVDTFGQGGFPEKTGWILGSFC